MRDALCTTLKWSTHNTHDTLRQMMEEWISKRQDKHEREERESSSEKSTLHNQDIISIRVPDWD
jgi:hypothetical protein